MKELLKYRFFRILKRLAIWLAAIYIILQIVFFVGNRLEIKNTIYEKGAIEVPYLFEVLKNETFYNPTAFDSDYNWEVKIKVSEAEMANIVSQITHSPFFQTDSTSYAEYAIQDSLKSHQLNGFWVQKGNTYIFHQSFEDMFEPTKMTVYKDPRIIYMDFTHL